MIGQLLLLGIAIFGILVMFGRADIKRILWLIPVLIFGPILLSTASSHLVVFWDSLSPFWKFVTSVSLAFVLPTAVRTFFPRMRWPDAFLDVLGRAATWVVAFPFRILYRAGLLIFDRERRPQRLVAHRRTVGGAPPFERRTGE